VYIILKSFVLKSCKLLSKFEICWILDYWSFSRAYIPEKWAHVLSQFLERYLSNLTSEIPNDKIRGASMCTKLLGFDLKSVIQCGIPYLPIASDYVSENMMLLFS
jgi:hypothetical protein